MSRTNRAQAEAIIQDLRPLVVDDTLSIHYPNRARQFSVTRWGKTMLHLQGNKGAEYTLAPRTLRMVIGHPSWKVLVLIGSKSETVFFIPPTHEQLAQLIFIARS